MIDIKADMKAYSEKIDTQKLENIRPLDIRTVTLGVRTITSGTSELLKLTIAETTSPYSQAARKGNVVQFRIGDRDLFMVNIDDIPTLIAIIKSFDQPRPFKNEDDRHNARSVDFNSTHQNITTTITISETDLHYEPYSIRDVLEVKTGKTANKPTLFVIPRLYIGPLTSILGGFVPQTSIPASILGGFI